MGYGSAAPKRAALSEQHMRQLIYSLILFFPWFHHAQCEEMPLQAAHSFYQQGIQATERWERQNAFNAALALYLSIEQQETNDSYQLYQAIGDTYFQLNAYAWSILYYYRALEIELNNPHVEQKLQAAQAQLGLPQGIQRSLFNQFLSFNLFSLALRQWTLVWLTLLALYMGSLTIWFGLWKKVALFLFSLVALLMLNILISMYLAPIEGILVLPSAIYQAPGFNQPQLTSIPLVKGIKVSLIGIEDDWLKVITAEGAIGYIPFTALRLIQSSPSN
jgi:hypothetical protein